MNYVLFFPTVPMRQLTARGWALLLEEAAALQLRGGSAE